MSSERVTTLNVEQDTAYSSSDAVPSLDISQNKPEADSDSSVNTSSQSSSHATSDTEATEDLDCECPDSVTKEADAILSDLDAFWHRPAERHFLDNFREERGKMTLDGYRITGDYLWNFFLNIRAPKLLGDGTITSDGLKKAQLLRSGRLASLAQERKEASDKSNAQQVFPFDAGLLVCAAEYRDDGHERVETVNTIPLSPLQQSLPAHLLPETLIVHDPHNTLSVDSRCEASGKAGSEEAHGTHTYRLSQTGRGEVTAFRDKSAAEQNENRRVLEQEDEWRIFHPSSPFGTYTIYAKVPPRLARPTSIPAAQLHIRRSDQVGEGHHSVVYDVQLELPRWVLCEDVLCESCWWIAFNKAMDEHAALFVPLPEEKPDEFGFDSEVSVQRSPDRPHKEQHDHERQSVLSTGSSIANRSADRMEDCDASRSVLRIYPEIEWQRPGVTAVCEHVALSNKSAGTDGRPATARVRVCAKMSHEDDMHLEQEAENYQSFPSTFFKHWEGSQVVPPRKLAIARGAIVPQFYGYFEPDEDNSNGTYLSPLLLLENCGKQIDVATLNSAEREECASLYFRMLRQRWSQGSIFPRNVVWQSGPITSYPPVRNSDQRIFRLIDFGRANKPSIDSLQYQYDKSYIYDLFEFDEDEFSMSRYTLQTHS